MKTQFSILLSPSAPWKRRREPVHVQRSSALSVVGEECGWNAEEEEGCVASFRACMGREEEEEEEEEEDEEEEEEEEEDPAMNSQSNRFA